jgi:hypothetical protein
VPFAGRPVEQDTSPGAWIAAAVHDSLDDVGSLVPPGFQAYARVLHPPVRYDGDDDVEVSWAAVAEHNGTVAHPLMQWPTITGSWDYLGQDDQPELWNDSPAEGHLPTAVARRLIRVLARHTTTPTDCFFGLWEGGGVVAVSTPTPTLALPHRSFWLVRGPIGLAEANLADEPYEQSAHLWWPADRAWCVATDIDLMSTYVGGSAACIADLLVTDGVQAVPASVGDSTYFAADTINPSPDRN